MARDFVVAVVVAHDGARWLPRLLSALGTASRSADLVVGVDTGSSDASASLLRASAAVDIVVEASRESGFGSAVSSGLEAAAPALPGVEDGWIWLLHDDCAPAPDALERLLDVVAAEQDVAVVGCRMRAWPSGRRLLEVGVTITGTGHRETGVELGEYDQGQHDELRDVLAVSSAGMLVRRDVWRSLGGFDPELPLFRDDVDFGWRAAAAGHRVVVAGGAAVFHAEAASRGVRATTCTTGSPHRADRRAALRTVLANCRSLAFPFVFVRLLVGSVVRATGFLVGKLPSAAWDEVCAVAAVYCRPGRLVRARSHRRRTRSAGASVRGRLPPWWTPYANGLDAVLGRFGEPLRDTATTVATSARRLRSHPVDPADPAGARGGPSSAGQVLARHPLLLLTVVLTVISLLAARGLLGSGFLQGGALPAAPDAAASWWRLYAESAHDVGLGSTQPTAPYVAMLALGATVLLGKAWLAVDVLMLCAAPLAALAAWAAAGAVVRGVGARLWMAAAYGLVPVVTGATSSGHVGTVVATIALPWVLREGSRLLHPQQPDGWRRAAGLGLSLSVLAAFAPVGWPIVGSVGLAGAIWLLTRRRPLRALQLVFGLVLPVALLLPWSWRLLGDPSRVMLEAGLVAVPGSGVSAADLALASIGAVGAAPVWVTAGLPLLALLSLLRRDTRSRVASAWTLVVAGLVGAAVLAYHPLELPGGGGSAYPWLGVPLVVASAGAIAAAGIAADGLSGLVGSGSFGWRQPVAACSVVAGAATVVLGLGWEVAAAPHGSLHRGVAVPVPAYMVEAMSVSRQRVLVLTTGDSGVRYRVLAGDGVRLGDDSVLPTAAAPELPRLVAGLVSQSRETLVRRLGELGVGYVVVESPQSPAVVAALDAAAGLTRTSSRRSALSGWQLDADLVHPVDLPAAPDRSWWLVGQGVLWGGVVLLAAPAVRRRPLPAATVEP